MAKGLVITLFLSLCTSMALASPGESSKPASDNSSKALSQNFDWQNLTTQLQNQDMVEMSQEQLAEKTREAVHNIVNTAIEALKAKGFARQAQETQEQFSAFEAIQDNNMIIMDLGDHAPLNQWLADQYKKWENFLGDAFLVALHLDDINTVNYAVPVVFDPIQGRSVDDQIDEAEYNRHFVPLTGVVTYWTSFVGCEVAAAHVAAVAFLKNFCSVVAGGLRHGMENVIAPPWGARVYHDAVKKAQKNPDQGHQQPPQITVNPSLAN